MKARRPPFPSLGSCNARPSTPSSGIPAKTPELRIRLPGDRPPHREGSPSGKEGSLATGASNLSVDMETSRRGRTDPRADGRDSPHGALRGRARLDASRPGAARATAGGP